MVLSSNTALRAIAAGIGTGTVAGVMFFAAATATAQPAPPASPPNCTAADLAGVSSGVSAATSAYLFTHPDVNAFFTGLTGQPRSAVTDDVQNYLNTNPQVQTDLQGIRQPLVDFRNRCGAPGPTPLAPNGTGQ